ncbi:MAG: hypothetical protein ACOYYS_26485 [Chloroflexota bacterium]
MPPQQRPSPRGNPIERFQKRVVAPLIQNIRGLFQNLASGDQSWARFRLFFALGATMVLVVLMFLVVDLVRTAVRRTPTSTPTGPTPMPTLTLTPSPAPLPTTPGPTSWVEGVIRDEVGKIPSRMRYIYAPLIAALIVLLYGARYIQDVYELHQYGMALRYFLSSIFGVPSYPVMKIAAGEKVLRPGEENPLDLIGGPGYVVIAPGNAVLFERLTGPAAVRPAGKHFISRFERIAAVVTLDEQTTESSHRATTRDGIPVEARNVRSRYRLLPGRRFSGPAGRAMIDPYPFSTKAVINMAYNRNVRADGLMRWDAAIVNAIDTAITGYIAGTTLDKLISPGLAAGDPNQVTRELVQKALFSPGTRAALRNFGVELVFCDIGHFAVNDAGIAEIIQTQRTNTWKAYWIGVASKTRSDAEARRMAYQDLGRAEVQAEMLMSIARALEDSGLNMAGSSLDNLDNIILMRTAQIIEALSEQNIKTEDD